MEICTFCGKSDSVKLVASSPRLFSFAFVQQSYRDSDQTGGALRVKVTVYICHECTLKCCERFLELKVPDFEQQLRKLVVPDMPVEKPALRGNGGLAGTCPACTDGQTRDICPVCHKCI